MNQKTILVVDDEAHILHVVSLKLQNAGFNVMTARDADEALEVATSSPIDLVITDYQMPPGPSGIELARRLHGHPGKARLPIILLTAHGLGIEPVDLAHAGIVACIAKPFSPREILGKVNGFLEVAQPVATAP